MAHSTHFVRMWTAAAILAAVSAAPAAAQTTYTWNGGSSVDSNWTSAANWTNGTPVSQSSDTFLKLAGTTRLTNTLDFDLAAATLTYDSSAGAFVTSGGNTLTLTNGITVSTNSSVAFNAPLALSFGQSWTNSGAGTFSVGGTVDNGGFGLTVTGAGNTTVSGVISGGGSLTKTGAGTLLLTNANTYSGGTTVSAGTLQIGNGGTTGSVTGDILDNSAVVFNYHNATLTYSGVISGTGTVTKLGSGGQLILTGANTFTGTLTTNSSGEVEIGGAAGSVTADINNNGGLFLNRTTDWVYGGVLSGNGGGSGLTKKGSANVTLTGANTYTGSISVQGGTLQFGNGGTAGTTNSTNISVSTGAVLVFDRSDAVSFGGVIKSGGAVTQLGGGTLTFTGDNTYTGVTTISAGTLQIGNGGTTGSVAGLSIVDNAALTFNRSDAVAYAGVISGTGTLAKSGAGTLTLSNTNTYSGLTTVSAGTLLVTGSLAAGGVNVGSGATLGGTGTIGGAVTLTGGHLAPGTSPGTLTVASLLMDSASFLDMELGSPASDKLLVTGNAGLDGTLNVTLFNGFTPTANQSFDLIDWGTVSGAFATLSLPDISGQGLAWDTSALASAGIITAVAPVPEPAALLALALPALAAARRLLRRSAGTGRRG